jgi:hypothetical protein
MLRLISVGAMALVLLATSAASISPAAARQYRHSSSGPSDRYCLQGRHWGYPGNCRFATYEQCRISASGTGAACGINPHYAHRR